ncbi:MAG: hypothetical protein QW035_01685 [Candidatus Anstonellales archaeon]
MIPNIYHYDYKLLAILPILLLLAALYFIPSIKMGVDFMGGTLVSAEQVDSIDAPALKQALEEKGFNAEVSVFEALAGKKVEIKVETPAYLYEASSLYKDSLSLIDQVSEAQVKNEVGPREELNKKANALFRIAGGSKNAESITNLNDLKDTISDAYREIEIGYEQKIRATVSQFIPAEKLSVQSVSPALSSQFFSAAMNAAILAAVLSIVTVYLFFRRIIPSLAVLIGAACDIVLALGAMGLFGIPLSLASFAALLMLVGFSLDTDMVLTNRMIKRRGDPKEKAFDALQTGVTMSLTAIGSFLVLFAVSQITHISVYYQISAVALAGLVGDLFATWGINAVIMLLHAEGKI